MRWRLNTPERSSRIRKDCSIPSMTLRRAGGGCSQPIWSPAVRAGCFRAGTSRRSRRRSNCPSPRLRISAPCRTCRSPQSASMPAGARSCRLPPRRACPATFLYWPSATMTASRPSRRASISALSFRGIRLSRDATRLGSRRERLRISTNISASSIRCRSSTTSWCRATSRVRWRTGAASFIPNARCCSTSPSALRTIARSFTSMSFMNLPISGSAIWSP